MSEKILVLVNDSEPAMQGIRRAVTDYPTAEITALIVIEFTKPPYGLRWMVRSSSRLGVWNSALDVLETARDTADEHGVSITTALEQGLPKRVIVSYADEHDFDRIIMGSHCRTGIDRLACGSIAEAVIRRSSVPVTVTN